MTTDLDGRAGEACPPNPRHASMAQSMPTRARGTVRTKFVLALVSSWVASPLSIGFAHLAGFANAPAVVVSLLAAGAIAPIQVLINEALVPAIVVKGNRLPGVTEAALCALQAATVATVFLYATAPAVGIADVLLAVVAGTVASLFSTRAAGLQLEAILAGTLRHRTVMLVSATPGLLMLVVFVLLGVLRHLRVDVSFRVVYATVALPAVVQVLLLKANRAPTPGGRPRVPGAARVSSWFFCAAVVLLGAASAATAARAGIAGRYERVTSLILLALNSTFALSFTFSKILFLERRARALFGFGPALAVVAALAILMNGVTRAAEPGLPGLFGLLATLVALQFAMTTAISATRDHVHERA